VHSDWIAFGEWLRHAREQSGVTLEQIARETKIRPFHLDALEKGRLSEIPGGAYRRGETIAYAKAIGMNPTIALERLEQALQGSPSSQAVAARHPTSSSAHAERTGAFVSAVVVMLAVVAIVLWTRAASTPDQPRAIEPAPQGAETASPPAAPTPAQRTNDPARAEPTAPPSTNQDANAAPAPVQPDSGRLTIVTDPSGARVTLNGIGRGSTPLTLSNVSAGLLRVRVTKDGHVSQESVVEFTGSSMTVKISLPVRQR
jgi:cytoskeleton protein RodZ